jgi:hypothetical protein
MQSITVQGASVFCLINGAVFGRVTGFSFSSETQRKALYGIDSVDPVDLIPTITRLTGRLEVVRTKSDGGLEGAGIVAPYEFLSNEKYITIMLLSRELNPYKANLNKNPLVASVGGIASPGQLEAQGVLTAPAIAAEDNTATRRPLTGPASGNRTVIFRTDNAQVVNQSWQVNARGLMTGSFTFEALTWSNEVENAF